MHPGETLTVEIASVLPTGEGVALVDGTEVRIGGAVTGDRVRVEVVHKSQHRSVVWAEIDAVVSRGPSYVAAPCPHAAPTRGRCGGCALQHIDVAGQLACKRQSVIDALGARCPEDLAVEPAPTALGYRARANFVVVRGHDGRARLGSYAPRSHDVVAMTGCLSARSPVTCVADQLPALIDEVGVATHPATPGLRYVTVRANQAAETLVDLVVNAPAPDWLSPLAGRIYDLPDVVGVSVSVNASKGNALRTAESTAVQGVDAVIECFGDIGVWASAASFTQLNADVATAMYERAADWVGDCDVVWDLYCGVGAFGLTVARLGGASTLFGAESIDAACRLARRAGGQPALQKFAVVDLEADTPRDWPAPDVVLVNPPRRGLSQPVRQLLPRLKAPVVYMSCNPKSFARDAATLEEAGLSLTRLSAFDMLPQTPHVELLGRFSS